MSSVAFVGSRSLPAEYQPLVTSVVGSFPGHTLITTCGTGACEMVRQAAGPGCLVFRVEHFSARHYVGRLVQRGVAMVHLLASQPQPLMVGFVTQPCPVGLIPSTKSGHCWAGYGSGSWAELAFAAAHGVPVQVYWCAPGPPILPASWGQWLIPAGIGSARQPASLLSSFGVQASFGPE